MVKLLVVSCWLLVVRHVSHKKYSKSQMNYYNLYIHFEGSPKTCHAVSEILGVKPKQNTLTKFDTSLYNTWWYQVVRDDSEPPFDFINAFLDLVEPHFGELAKLGIDKNDIFFWRVYEYDKQCAMEFNPQEMKRLGESGISLNIDCFEIKEETE